MRKLTFFIALMLSAILFLTNCSKKDTGGTSGSRLRITRMGSTDFKYNDKGLLSRIFTIDSNNHQYIDDIQYNSNNKPIKINSSAESNHFWETTIEWVNNGFTASVVNLGGSGAYKSAFELNAKNQITKITDYDNPVSVHNFIWRGDSLIIPGDVNLKTFTSYNYVKKNSPFSGINIAIIELCGDHFYYGFNREYQNIYCPSTEYYYVSPTDHGLTNIRYTFNPQNFPISAELPNPEMANTMMLTYFEYESY